MMHRCIAQHGFTLVEILTVMAIILVLAGALLGVGRYLTVRASVDLTVSELEVIATALQQYYDDMGAFPFYTTDASGVDVTDGDSSGYLLDEYLNVTTYSVTQGTVPLEVDDPEFSTSCALFYLLDRNPNSRAILDAMMDSLISNKDAGGAALKVSINGAAAIDMPRFIDAWGTSIRYAYIDGTAFPTLTSAGPDEKFDTPDDIVN